MPLILLIALTRLTYRRRSGRQVIVVATGMGTEHALMAFALEAGSGYRVTLKEGLVECDTDICSRL
jgi:hypothetical protein